MSEANTIKDPAELTGSQLWATEIEAAEKEFKKFHERGHFVNKRFIDERGLMDASRKWFNIFFANTQILESALYAQLPKPVVSRKYQDFNDDVARVAAMILQRCVTQDLDDPNDNFDAVMRHCVQDRLVPGLSQAWLRLETDTALQEVSDITPPTPGTLQYDDGYEAPPQQAEPAEIITNQKVCIDYVFWEDFLISPCRVWEERRWVARRVYMTRPELVKRFGELKGNAANMNFANGATAYNSQGSMPKEDVLQKAIVYEIWDRSTRQAIWYNKGMTELLDEKDDPLRLEGFEPCPRPMLANVSTSNVVPRPDYYMIQDQYSELDTLNNRISMLIQACKVVGVYDKTAIGISRMLTEGSDNMLIPVDNWAMFAEKGGIKGAIDWLPLDVVVQALQQLNGSREAIKGQIYELTGIADIVRGASKASETLGAQQIKAQFASVRIKKLQDEVARFAADIMRIKAEIMVKHFEPQLLIKKSNIEATGEPQFIEPAIALLMSEEGFEWRIEVNADTLAQADYAAEKTDRTEFMAMMSKFMAQYGPMIQSAPAAAPLLLTMLKWSVAGFRNARDIEGILDRELDTLLKEARKPKQPAPPPPEVLKLQAEMQMLKEKHQMEMQSKQLDVQMDQQQAAAELQQQRMEAALAQQREEMELALERQRREQEMMFDRLMGMLKLQQLTEQSELKLETAREQAKIKTDTTRNGAAN